MTRGPKLGEGERAAAAWVRGPAEAVTWWLALSPAERGLVIARGYRVRHVVETGRALRRPRPGRVN